MDKHSQLASLYARADKIAKNPNPTPAENIEFDSLLREMDKIRAEDRQERLAFYNERVPIRAGREDIVAGGRQDCSDESRAFENYLRVGISGLNDQDKRVMLPLFRQDNGIPIQMAQGTGTGSAGGFLVPDESMGPLNEAMKQFGGLAQFATILETSSGADLPIPTDSDTSNSGEIIAENAQHNEQDVSFGQTVLKSFLYSSKIVRASWQLIDDSSVSLNEYVPRKLGERLGRATSAHYITGAGTTEPEGLLTGATVGKTAAATGAVTYDELVDLVASVDPAYHTNGRWLMNLSTLLEIRKLKDSQNRPLFGPDVAAGTPNSLLGFQVVIDQGMPSMAASAKSIAFGDLSAYHIRQVRGVRVLRLVERYADTGQVGFIGFIRVDGALINAAAGPVKVLQMAAS